VTSSTTGDIRAFAEAISADRVSPDLTKYLLTVNLTDDERASVASSFATWNSSVVRPSDVPVPSIVDRWF
jgi:hypothetical protein